MYLILFNYWLRVRFSRETQVNLFSKFLSSYVHTCCFAPAFHTFWNFQITYAFRYPFHDISLCSPFVKREMLERRKVPFMAVSALI